MKINLDPNQEPDENALPVKEFGQSLAVIGNEDLDKESERLLRLKISEMEKVLSYITDVHYVQKFDIVQGPVVDKLRRYRQVGYYGLVASKGYDVLSDYFKVVHTCRLRHRPERTDFKFVVSVLKDWLRDRNTNDWDDED